jgi:hypothetical protein
MNAGAVFGAPPRAPKRAPITLVVLPMNYRSHDATCACCDASMVLSTCQRCQSPLCFEHTPPNDQRCARCEADWAGAA